MTGEELAALDVARQLADAGVPVAVCYPDPEGKTQSGRATGYMLPPEWEKTSANPAYVNAWRPGMALIAVMGHGLDLADVDPRNGGQLGDVDGITPRVRAVASTPSGGTHLFVSSMGVRSRDDLMPGIDVKAGTGGQGVGFAFIAPTVRKSKVTGQPIAYRWIEPPDVDGLGADSEAAAGSKLAELVRQVHSKTSPGFQQPGGHSDGWTDPDIAQLIRRGIPAGHAQQPVLRDTVARLVGQGYDPTVCWGIWQAIVDRTALTDPAWPWAEADFADMYESAARKYGTRPAGRHAAPAADPDGLDRPETLTARLLPGGRILDVPAVPDAVWGDGPDVLWAYGQAVIIAGPDGVGKTTVAGNLIEARLGLGTGEVLGLPVKPGDRNVLVLLMDRPQQAMAALARLFTSGDREVLDARLRIWRGPPPQDLARNSTMLTTLCVLADADTCVIDSLKDAALELTKDEAGSGWNRARQLAIEAGTQLVELHHPRKGQDGNRKPSRLDDLYGSRWISAGAGSVISLWGQAGDPIVELTHLKPAAETVGPWNVAINNTTGRVSVSHGIDLMEQIRLRGSNGITAQQAATLLFGSDKPSKADVEKARRRLDRKVADGVLTRSSGQPGGVHGGVHAAYFPKAFTRPFTPDHGNQETAGQIDHGSVHAPFTPMQAPERSRATPHIKWGSRERCPADDLPGGTGWPAGSIGDEVNR